MMGGETCKENSKDLIFTTCSTLCMWCMHCLKCELVISLEGYSILTLPVSHHTARASYKHTTKDLFTHRHNHMNIHDHTY